VSCGDDGIPTTAAWLRARARVGRRDASGMAHQARELRHLTATGAALATGSISTAHTAEIVKAKKRSGMDTDEFASNEQILVELVTQASPDEVRAAVTHLVEVEAPECDKQLLDALADRTMVFGPAARCAISRWVK